MRDFDVVAEFVDASRQAADTFSLATAFESATDKLGVKHFACVSHVDWCNLPEGAVALSNYPAAWVTRFFNLRLERIDPVFQRVESELSPFLWDEPAWRSGLSQAQRRLFDEARCWGIEHGVTVPLHLAGAAPASCSFVFESPEIDPQCVHALHLMAAYLYEAGRQLEPVPVLLPYSPGLPDALRLRSDDVAASADSLLAALFNRQVG